ncbi:tumor necrosis factor receptor superfamily member 10A-like isoform X2 [Erythrolamprus reginae]|uniref:tumor necrosis factor receptor superfamily member 10A-like isoform X2 n=1 Tax=Erythrolamprus reginae TaxID=121349 RepID=UPI00396C6DD8
MRASWLLTLCIVAYLWHEATTATLPRTRNPEVILPEKADNDTNQYYMAYDNHICKKCPPGTYVLNQCTFPRTEGTCQPCEKDRYYKTLNSYHSCFSCRACRTLDEVEIKKCTATTNTECACKNGTFCSSSQPCEICTKCMTSCGPGERKVQDCTPTSDIQCLPDTTSSPATSSPGQGSHGLAWGIAAGVVVVLVVLVLCVCCWKKHRTVCTGFLNRKRTQFFGFIQKSFNCSEPDNLHDNPTNGEALEITTPLTAVPPEELFEPNEESSSRPEPSKIHDNMHMEENPKISCNSTANGEALGMTTPLTAAPPEEESRQNAGTRRLVLGNGNTPVETLRKSFYTFISKVPTNAWKKFMRHLQLTENEIDSVEKSCNTEERHYQMLQIWLNKTGKAASLSHLLGVLCAMNLKGVAEDITSVLIDQHFYIYEE